MVTEVPEELIRPAAEVLERHYDQEYDAPHLSWKDFTGEAKEILAAVQDRHERIIRAKVAEEIFALERRAPHDRNKPQLWHDGYAAAANDAYDTARGES